MQKVEEMLAFTFSWTVYLRVTNGRSDETAFAGKQQSGETPSAYAYGCPPLQRNGGAVAAKNLVAHRSQETPVQADTMARRAQNQESMASRLSEETARTGGGQKRRRGASVRGDHRARRARDQERASGKSPSRWACCFSWSWSRWFRHYQSSDKLFGMSKQSPEKRTHRSHAAVTQVMEHRRHGHSFSWREHTYIGKPKLSSLFSKFNTMFI